jgi:hypothetical protein
VDRRFAEIQPHVVHRMRRENVGRRGDEVAQPSAALSTRQAHRDRPNAEPLRRRRDREHATAESEPKDRLVATDRDEPKPGLAQPFVQSVAQRDRLGVPQRGAVAADDPILERRHEAGRGNPPTVGS